MVLASGPGNLSQAAMVLANGPGTTLVR
jgi:hypothetical protein